MSYLVLARKFRPQTFAQVSGQEQVTRTLANAIKRNRIAHAYLFSGPRGVGKTSIARIFAKALNCKNGPTATPCGQCSNCLEVTAGNNLAVREIDGASHNSVDNVRDLIDSFRAAPPPGSRYKVYIIDEVHMLSTAAFNALLKSLEEPPPNTVFVLATTEAHKIPETVISRCQRHDFRALGQAEIESRLQQIASEEQISIEPEALRMICRLADGSMRDAQSLLERVRAFCDDQVTAVETGKVLGTVERSIMFELSRAIFARDSEVVLTVIDQVFSAGIDPTLFLKDFVAHFRELLLGAFGGEAALRRLGLIDSEVQANLAQISNVSKADLQDLFHMLRDGADVALRSAYPRYALESVLVRMATREPVVELAKLLAHLEHGPVSGGGSSSGGSSSGRTGGAQGSGAGGSGAANTAKPKAANFAAEKSSAAEPAAAAVPLIWSEFVKFVSASGARFIAEGLKRVAITNFSAGIVEGHAPDFTVNSLTRGDGQQRLQNLLSSYSGIAKWHVKVNCGSVDGVASLHQAECDAAVRNRKEREADLSNHPKVKSFQKLFPGSKIESIRLKEN